jgi:lipoprotein-releasing system permease protein
VYKYFLAVRYLVSRPINLIGTIGVTLAVWALIFVVSIFTGYIHEMRLHVRGTASDLSLLFDRSQDSFAQVEPLLRHEGVRAIAPRLSWYGLLDPVRGTAKKRVVAATAGQPTANFFQVVGIDFAREAEIGSLRDELEAVPDADRRVVDGQRPFLIKGKQPGMLIGLSRARAWDVRRGDSVALTTAMHTQKQKTVSLRTIEEPFVITGAYSSRHHEFESSTVLLDIETMRRLVPSRGSHRDHFDEIAIALHDPTRAIEIRDLLNARLAKAGAHGQIAAWQERKPIRRFLDNVEHQRSLMSLVLIALIAIACFLVLATLLMMVSEKTRDIGVLTALGSTRRGILMIFLNCGLVISTLGVGLGVLAGWLTCRHLNDITDWLETSFGIKLFPSEIYGLKEIPYELEPRWIVIVAGSAIGAVLLFSLIPAAVAATRNPVQALRQT